MIRVYPIRRRILVGQSVKVTEARPKMTRKTPVIGLVRSLFRRFRRRGSFRVERGWGIRYGVKRLPPEGFVEDGLHGL